jgi:nucleoside phosphorylase
MDDVQNVFLLDGSQDYIWKIPAFSLPGSSYIQSKPLLERCLSMQSIRNRSGNTTDSVADLWGSIGLHSWAKNEESSLIVVQGTSQSTCRLERFSCEIVEYLTEQQPTIYMINSASTRDHFKTLGPLELLRQITIQALQKAMPSKPVYFLADVLEGVREVSTLANWFKILDTVMQQFSGLFIVVDLSILGVQWKADVESLYQEFASLRMKSSSCVKVMLLTNRRQFQITEDVFSIQLGSKSSQIPMKRTAKHERALSHRGSLPIFFPQSLQIRRPTASCEITAEHPQLPVQGSKTWLDSTASNSDAEVNGRPANLAMASMPGRYNTTHNTQSEAINLATASREGSYKSTHNAQVSKGNKSVPDPSRSDLIPHVSSQSYSSSAASRRQEIDVAIICALSWEGDAMEVLFDEELDIHNFSKLESDTNSYSVGIIGRHKVVLAFMPSMGQSNAATAATNCRASFPKIRLALITGICGGVPCPNPQTEIVLGDVVISDGTVFFDFGRQFPDGFQRKNTTTENARKPPDEILAFLAKLKTRRSRDKVSERTALHVKSLHGNPHFRDWATYPGIDRDILFPPMYFHRHHGEAACKACSNSGDNEASVCNLARESRCSVLQCDIGSAVPRRRHQHALENSQNNPDTNPAIFFGTYASGDKVMKSGKDRDSIAQNEGVIAFEMEGAGIWDKLPCLIVKGVCDYADSHKNKDWQTYAATTAAACTKALLEEWSVRA